MKNNRYLCSTKINFLLYLVKVLQILAKERSCDLLPNFLLGSHSEKPEDREAAVALERKNTSFPLAKTLKTDRAQGKEEVRYSCGKGALW